MNTLGLGFEEVRIGDEDPEPRNDDPRHLSDGLREAHQARALVVVGCHLIAQPDKWRGINCVSGDVNEGEQQEVPEVVVLRLVRVELPQQHEKDAAQDRTDEDERLASTKSRFGVVGDVAHDGVGERIEQARKSSQQTRQERIHTEGREQEEGKHAQCSGKEVVDEVTRAEGGFLTERNGLSLRHEDCVSWGVEEG